MDRRDGPVRWEFRQAGPTDTPAAQAVYRQIIGHLAATAEFPHWHTENRPSRAEVQEWIEADELYLALEPTGGRIAGVVALNHDAPTAYLDASWAIEVPPAEILVVHALGVSPDFLRQGVARFLVDGSLEVAREKGCRVVRLDTYVENIAARTLYARCGFTDLGVHALHYEGTDLNQFHLFERVL